MIHVMARIAFRPEAAAAGLEILAGLTAATRAGEPGCLGYAVFRQLGAPHLFRTVEQWADQAAVDAHMASAHVARAFAAATPLLAEPPEILSFEQVP
jgi:quinol monooxygenase YgiN